MQPTKCYAMKIKRPLGIMMLALMPGIAQAQQVSYVRLRTADGVLEGVVSPDGKVRTFKGVPYAAPPVGPLRWKPPQPVVPWAGVRKAAEYGARAMQGRIYDDMVFHDDGPSEDCLYLNLWMPANPPQARLPVMVWIHGGGFVAGSSSEPRQDAGNLSKKGVMVVSFNYRMGVFGFLALPGLSGESEHKASGNYGLLDQVAALEWVRRNIATFGGDPDNVTIFGESAGSASVSGLVASPLARGLFRRAIGESGAFFKANPPMRSRAEAEEAGEKFAQAAFGTTSVQELRSKPAREVLDAALRLPHEYFEPEVDGYFLPEDCASIYARGGQSRVALLAGWNRDEAGFAKFLGKAEPTLGNYVARAREKFGANADAFLGLYPAASDAEARRAAQDIAGDEFIAHATWRWIEAHLRAGGSPVFRYEFDQTLPLAAGAKPGTDPLSPHACDIEYVFRVLSSRDLPWRQEDRDVSELISTYWTNFAKTGDPNGPGLPPWPAYTAKDGYQVMHIGAAPGAAPDGRRARHEFLDRLGSSL